MNDRREARYVREIHDEFMARAIMLGLSYDKWDHTFHTTGTLWDEMKVYDADTMEPLAYGSSNTSHEFAQRKIKVAKGLIGLQAIAVQREIERDAAHSPDGKVH